MAKVYVDTNCFIGLSIRSPDIDSKHIDAHEAFVSALSCHVLFYVTKTKVPSPQMNAFIEGFNILSLESGTVAKALHGPTDDLEDNIQLHSAALIDADYFVTLDKKLLKMKFFGRVQIVSPQNL